VITIHQCHGRTERRTDRRHAIAIPRFALKCIARVKTVHFWLEYNGLAIVGKTTKLIKGGHRGLQDYRHICYVFTFFQNPKS